MDVLAGTASSMRFELQGPDGSLLPVGGSVNYKIFGNDGTVLAGPTADATVLNFVDVPLADSLNTIAGGKRFEKRTVVVNWTSGGQGRSLRQGYRVVPFLNVTVTPAAVRTLLGVSDDELADSEVDLLPHYLALEEELTAAVLDVALSAGDLSEVRANELLALDIALSIAPSLRNRVLMARTEGDSKVERFRSAPDFEALMRDLRARREEAFAIVAGVAATVPIIAILTQPTDVITGA